MLLLGLKAPQVSAVKLHLWHMRLFELFDCSGPNSLPPQSRIKSPFWLETWYSFSAWCQTAHLLEADCSKASSARSARLGTKRGCNCYRLLMRFQTKSKAWCQSCLRTLTCWITRLDYCRVWSLTSVRLCVCTIWVMSVGFINWSAQWGGASTESFRFKMPLLTKPTRARFATHPLQRWDRWRC